MVHTPQERALCQHPGRGVSPPCEASGKEKQVSQPFPTTPLFISVFQWVSRSADSLLIFSVCWEVHGIGVSKGFIASQQALKVLVCSPTVILAFP